MVRTAKRIDWDEFGSTRFTENAPSSNRPLGPVRLRNRTAPVREVRGLIGH